MLFILLSLGLVMVQCKDDNANAGSNEEFPQKFTVDIPSAISNNNTLKSGNEDGISGAETYEHLRNFIAIGEEAANWVEEIMVNIAIYGLNKPMDFPYVGDDGRKKILVVSDDVQFEGKYFEHQLDIIDWLSDENDDGGYALQVFWSGSPVNGIAILKPYNWDRVNDENIPNTMFRIDYSEAGASVYDATMQVSISNWEYDHGFDRFNMDNLKMFVGKKGDVIDVYGNSNHPDAWLYFDDTVGLSWAFVASGSDSKDIAVAEVGLPWSSVDSDSRDSLLNYYSVKNVFSREVTQVVFEEYGYEPTADMLKPYLVEVNAPAFFNQTGFVSGGEMPNDSYQPFINNIGSLVPFNPKEISEMELNFKN